MKEGFTDNYPGTIGVSWDCPCWTRMYGPLTHCPLFSNWHLQRMRVMLRHSWLPWWVFCGLFLTWIQWCVTQCGTHHGIDDLPRRGVRRDAAESEPLSMGVCFQTDLSEFRTRPSPLSGWIARFMWELSGTRVVNQGLSTLRTWRGACPSSQELRRGSLCPPPSPGTEEGWWKKAF